MYKILVINPGSTSTKFAVFHDEKLVFQQTLRHSGEELKPFPTIASQYEFRKEVLLNCLTENQIPLDFDIIVGRGGILKPLDSGVYAITETMKADLLSAKYGEHACNLGGLIQSQLIKLRILRSMILEFKPTVLIQFDRIEKLCTIHSQRL
jgi:butyrate kinase